MKVTISVGGRFHAFYLAQQLVKRGFLERLITSYPKFEVKKYGIPPEKTKSILIKEIIQRIWEKLPGVIRGLYNPQYLIHEIFDTLASKKISKSDIFVGFSSFSLHSLRKAKEMGMVIVIERGSSHMLYQEKILKEECEKFGATIRLPHPKIVEKELKEYEEADYIAVPSFFVKRTFLERGIPEAKLIHVPYGVNLTEFQQVPKSDKIFRVVFAGGISLRKGVHYLLQAFAELKLQNAELLLIGTLADEMKPFFRRYEGTFRYLGRIPQRELAWHYSQSSVFAIMSIEEGMAMVQLQAMACGLPVIATTNTGAEDIVRDGTDGFIIPIRDVNALKEKISFLYEHQDVCAAMGQSAKKRVAHGFTWDDYGNRMVAEYQRILEKRQR